MVFKVLVIFFYLTLLQYMNCSKKYQERRIEEALFSMLTLGKKQLQLYT